MRTVTRRPANHPLHLILTIATCGLWAPVWVISAIVGRKTITTTPDTPQNGGWRP